MFESAKIKPAEKDSKVLGAVVYICSIFSFLGILVPVLVFLIAKEDKFARSSRFSTWHASLSSTRPLQ